MRSAQTEIDAEELMARIRATRAARADEGSSDFDLMSEPSGAVVPVPSVEHLHPPELKKGKLSDLLRVAREKITLRPGVPRMFGRLLRKQGAYDRALLDAATVLARTAEQLHKQAAEVAVYLEKQKRWLEALAIARAQDQARIVATEEELQRLRQLIAELAEATHPGVPNEQKADA